MPGFGLLNLLGAIIKLGLELFQCGLLPIRDNVGGDGSGMQPLRLCLPGVRHVIPGMQKEAAATVDAALQRAIKNREDGVR